MARAPDRVGCSGWQYAHWRADVYPGDLSQDRWLEHYALHFDTVELNYSFSHHAFRRGATASLRRVI